MTEEIRQLFLKEIDELRKVVAELPLESFDTQMDVEFIECEEGEYEWIKQYILDGDHVAFDMCHFVDEDNKGVIE